MVCPAVTDLVKYPCHLEQSKSQIFTIIVACDIVPMQRADEPLKQVLTLLNRVQLVSELL
jgi:hypothetical protein